MTNTIISQQNESYENKPLEDGPGCLNKKSSSILPINVSKEVIDNTTKFESLVEKSEQILFKTYAVFPFEFFPDLVTIDENKVNIIHNLFFYTHETQSILIHHIKDVIVDSSLFFASLNILPEGFNEQWVIVEHLKKNDAIKARRIIIGLLVGLKEGVDMTKVKTADFINKVEQLGAVG